MISLHRHACASNLSRLSLVILCLVCLSFTAAGPTAAAGDDENFFTHLHTGKAMANVTVSPGRAGPVEIMIELETIDEKPLSAKAVSVTLSDTRSGKRLLRLPAAHVGDHRWQVRVPKLAAGRLRLGLGISFSDTDKVQVEAPILIK